MTFKIEHHLLFCEPEGYQKAVKKLKNTKKYTKCNISGFIILIKEPLIKIDKSDYTSYVLATKAGLFRMDQRQFTSWEDFLSIIKDLDISQYKGIWGKFIVQV